MAKYSIMASINQLVSEIAHTLGQPNNYALRENIRLLIIHERNEKIRQSYEKHRYVDKCLEQRYKVEVINVPDGDIYLSNKFVKRYIKRTKNKVNKPIRFTNNLPFNRVSSTGVFKSIEIPFVRETRARFYNAVPGLCRQVGYDYINGYIYIFCDGDDKIDELHSIVIESVFELPQFIEEETVNEKKDNSDMDDEWLLPEDMIGIIKDTIFKRDLLLNERVDNEFENKNETQQ